MGLFEEIGSGLLKAGTSLIGNPAGEIISQSSKLIEDPKGWFESNILSVIDPKSTITPYEPDQRGLSAIGRLSPARANALIGMGRERYEDRLEALGMNPSAASAAGARFANRGFLQLTNDAGSLVDSLSKANRSLQNQARSIPTMTDGAAILTGILR